MMQKEKFFIPGADKTLGSRYELIECLGDGSHGWVWRAEKTEDHSIVAVKIPKAQGDPNEDLAEGQKLMGQPSHPNVINIYWMGRVPPECEWYAIEMEYFPSLTLSQLMDRGEQGFVASYTRILSLYQQVLAGVEHLHRLGMSHGDIKPQNILVSGDQAKLTDFGCSAMPEEMYARTRENGGTILYSAPEVVGRKSREQNPDLRFRADMYSLGVLLYHLVTSALPHDTLSQVERHAPFPRPREINTSVSPALEAFILRCLARDPAQRWGSVAEMSSAFRQVRQLQLEYSPVRTVPAEKQATEDWSSHAVKYLEKRSYGQAENVALLAFEQNRDPQAFLLMLTAAHHDGRYYDCVRLLESHPEMTAESAPLRREVRHLAISAYLKNRQVKQAKKLINQCLAEEGESPSLLLQKASILGVEANYEEACQILLAVNRLTPGSPAVLKRLALVYEQLRDLGKAAAFLRAYLKQAPQDGWAKSKLHQFSALGIR